ncbi:uncharacterized protein LOC127834519 [Dreissena polymorpha]|uniref:C1q domain-containing protein n=1 Tax=Dreissena polymorpha TaxID=45954 RepID=A0A9D4JE88_DREPO|nr:uncharacterized protein LOC127834519 [Dreissena polymorpha]KAH3806629.1 hypothetical protein DPMN_134952 [Dreissena polymorpha]
MLPALVLLLVYNVCFTHAYSFHPERRNVIIGQDLLLDLVKRMDAKDEEIKELRGIQEAKINKLMIQIGEQDVNINELRKKLNEKEKQQNENLNNLQQAVEKLQFENVQLHQSNSKFAGRIESLRAVMNNYIQTHNILKTFIPEKTSYDVKDEGIAIEDNAARGLNTSTPAITVTNNRRDAFGKNQKEERHAGTDMVAFFAALTDSPTNLGLDQNLRFDHVITNIGSAYNPHAGAFLAPMSGTYVFMSTLLACSGHKGLFKLAHNGNEVCKLYVAGTSDTQWDTSAGSFVLYLEKGDAVSIQNMYTGECVSGDHFSYFSGFILKAMEQNPSVVG